jgi:prevent-host-death family protein
MRAVTAREANQQFSKLLQRAEAGEEVVITKRGKPVAKLVPVVDAATEGERERRRREAIDHFREGTPLGPRVPWTREELYGERFERQRRRIEAE